MVEPLRKNESSAMQRHTSHVEHVGGGADNSFAPQDIGLNTGTYQTECYVAHGRLQSTRGFRIRRALCAVWRPKHMAQYGSWVCKQAQGVLCKDVKDLQALYERFIYEHDLDDGAEVGSILSDFINFVLAGDDDEGAAGGAEGAGYDDMDGSDAEGSDQEQSATDDEVVSISSDSEASGDDSEAERRDTVRHACMHTRLSCCMLHTCLGVNLSRHCLRQAAFAARMCVSKFTTSSEGDSRDCAISSSQFPASWKGRPCQRGSQQHAALDSCWLGCRMHIASALQALWHSSLRSASSRCGLSGTHAVRAPCFGRNVRACATPCRHVWCTPNRQRRTACCYQLQRVCSMHAGASTRSGRGGWWTPAPRT